ncbi:YdeI/OmpD-associated family protein [Sinomicrobium soli]|uniref:YdeI/OmpD-associated family protein n=1 Tax=Sinomicrobium sp. N-1-3-6 TaxID=2219864 RepID=UPI000DCBD6A8|nr:DUF1801 domain-containing protein [Sinomicrobium sp. N-1-3-6]RAV29313.1 hypothetical protein DN748_10415 [Sinomicrobium sp. N-1-3-6]
MNTKVDTFISKAGTWQKEFELLRKIALDCQLEEAFKWRHPCYMYKNSNIVLIHGFKEYCALLFFKGALLKDPHNILVQQTENVQAGRQVRFKGIDEIAGKEDILKTYIYEAIEAEKAGVKVPVKKTSEFPFPEELKQKFKEIPELKKAFYALTPGRQRGYLLYFSGAKQAATRISRIEKCTPAILEGKGLNDR